MKLSDIIGKTALAGLAASSIASAANAKDTPPLTPLQACAINTMAITYGSLSYVARPGGERLIVGDVRQSDGAEITRGVYFEDKGKDI